MTSTTSVFGKKKMKNGFEWHVVVLAMSYYPWNGRKNKEDIKDRLRHNDTNLLRNMVNDCFISKWYKRTF